MTTLWLRTRPSRPNSSPSIRISCSRRAITTLMRTSSNRSSLKLYLVSLHPHWFFLNCIHSHIYFDPDRLRCSSTWTTRTCSRSSTPSSLPSALLTIPLSPMMLRRFFFSYSSLIICDHFLEINICSYSYHCLVLLHYPIDRVLDFFREL